jgi:hypothetical protein
MRTVENKVKYGDRYSQIEDEVVEALLLDTIVQPD